jgi:small-conductance mechanosensitive channel
MAEYQQISTHEDAPPPVEGTKEHEQAMVQLAEEANSVEREDDQPSWLPDKFESPEDMARAYHELETKLSSNSESVTDNDEVAQPPQTPSPPQQEQINEAQKTLTNAGLDYNKFANEYAEKGELSSESYTELQSKGMSTEMVNSWIQGQEAISNKLTETAYNSVGGEEQYQNLIKWAGEILPQNEIDSFNRALESPNNQDSLFAIKSLNAQYQLANGSSPNLLQGSTGGSGAEAYTSLIQMSEAMRDPRYNSDPAFREEVTRKLESSNLM